MAVQTVAEAALIVRPDLTTTAGETKRKARAYGKDIGDSVKRGLNEELRQLGLPSINLKSNPREAIAAIQAVHRQLDELSGKAATVEVRLRIDKARRDLGALTKKIGDVGADAAPKFVDAFYAKLAPGLSSMPLASPLGASVVAAGLAVGPLLGGVISGAVIGGVGIGGVVGGFLTAAKDQRVQSSIEGMSAGLQTRLFRAGGAFVKPALDGLDVIERALDTVDIDQIFRDSARNVGPLAAGLASAITDIGDAAENLVRNAGPVVREISQGIADIGSRLSNGLNGMADNADAGAAALEDLFAIIGSSIDTVFMVVNGLTKLYEINKKLGGDFGLQLMLKLTGQEADEFDKSARRGAGGSFALGEAMSVANEESASFKFATEQLEVAQKRLKSEQDNFKLTLDGLGGGMSSAKMKAEALRGAMDSLYGASIRGAEANETYEAAWDDLSDSVLGNTKTTKDNNHSLNIHTESGRKNRDVLQRLLTSNNDLYIANIEAGKSVDSARKKHEERTKAIREEARRLGLNKDATKDLIDTYGQIPKKKATDLILDGVDRIVRALKDIYIYQRSLAEGIPVASMIAKLKNEKGPAKRYGGYALGGQYDGENGRLPGSPSLVDNLRGIGARGETIGLAGGEWIMDARRTQRYAPILRAMAEDEVPDPRRRLGFARGGPYAVDTSTRWPFDIESSGFKIMSKEEAAKHVVIPMGAFGNWPSSPGAQRGDSGVWRRIVALIRATGPLSGSFGNGYRPGDPKWHGSGRAVDWMGYNQDALATYLANRRPLELIHRTNKRDYAYTRGRNMGSFNNALMQAHRNHIHIAYGEGGQYVPTEYQPPHTAMQQLAKVAAADYGRVTLAPGQNLVYNGLGRPEHMAETTGGGTAPRMHPDDIAALASAISAGVAQALTGTVSATRAAARQSGRSGWRTR